MAWSYAHWVDQEEALRELGQCLRSSGLLESLACYQTPWAALSTETIRRTLAFLPAPLQTLTRFFILHEPVPYTVLEKEISQPILLVLRQVGLATYREQAFQMANFRLVYHFGIMAFVERDKVSITLYYGDDSLALGRFLVPVRGKALDLCAGVGTQGLLAALTADAVVSVEKLPAVTTLYRINALLNGLEHKMNLRIGDFLEPVQGETFDYVCCNPPLLPVPPDIPYPLAGHGGDDGLAYARQLLAALPELLTANGRCHLIGTLLGTRSGPDLTPFESSASHRELSLLLILPQRMRMAAGERMFDNLCITAASFGRLETATVRQAYLNHFESLGYDHLFTFILFARRAPRFARGTLEVTTHFERGQALWSI